MTAPPTITSSASAAVTTGLIQWTLNGPNASVFETIGGDRLNNFVCVTVSGALAQGDWAVSFVTDDPAPVIKVAASSAAKTARFIVDGQYASKTPLVVAASGSVYYILDFTAAGGRKSRTITIEGTQSLFFQSVFLSPIARPGRPSIEPAIVACCTGDSFTANAGASFPFNGYFHWATQRMGIHDLWNDGIGSTGLLADAGGTQTTARGRVSDIINSAADVVFMANGYNDTTFTGAQVQAEQLALLQAIRAGLPNALLITCGTPPGRSGPAGGLTTIENALSAAVTQFNDPMSVWIPVVTDPGGAWGSGTGYVGATTGGGNSDVYVGPTDTVHYNDAGHAYIGQRLGDAIIAKLRTL